MDPIPTLVRSFICWVCFVSNLTGHNSIILMIEAQSRYLNSLVGEVLHARCNGQTLALTPHRDRVREHNEQIQEALKKSSFADPNCRSWYKTEDGRITNNWPGTVIQYQNELSTVRWDDYIAEGTAKQSIQKKKPTKLGRVREELLVSNSSLALGAVGFLTVLGGYYMRGRMLTTR